MRLRPSARATLLLVVTFAAGLASGIYYERARSIDQQPLDSSRHGALHHLASELNLDPTQQEAITQIFARHQKELDAVWHSVQPHVRATLDATHQEVLALLRPDQADKFRRMMLQSGHTSGHR